MALIEGLRIHQEIVKFSYEISTVDFSENRCLATESKISTTIGQKNFWCSESKISATRLGLSQEPSPEPLHIFVLGPSIYGKRRLIECFANCNLKIPAERNAYLAYKLNGFLLKGIDVEICIWHVDNMKTSLSILQEFYQRFKTCFMLIYDVNDSTTFDDVHQWIPSLRNVLNHNVQIVLVGYEDCKETQTCFKTHGGKNTSKTLPVSYSDGMSAKVFFELEAFYEFSDMTGPAVSELFLDAAHIALESKVTTPNSKLSELEEEIDDNKN